MSGDLRSDLCLQQATMHAAHIQLSLEYHITPYCSQPYRGGVFEIVNSYRFISRFHFSGYDPLLLYFVGSTKYMIVYTILNI